MREGDKFRASLSDVRQWLVDMQDAVDGGEPITGETERLLQQNRKHEVRRTPFIRLDIFIFYKVVKTGAFGRIKKNVIVKIVCCKHQQVFCLSFL